jgi:glycosyltransferase involved in cell wall biosynthesis
MKVLLISGIPIFPAHEGNRSRILTLCKAIREQGHDLWIALLPAGISIPDDPAAHEAEFGKGRVVRLSRPPGRSPAEQGAKLSRLPIRALRKAGRAAGVDAAFYSDPDDLYFPGWTAELAALQAEHAFDTVLVEYVFHSAAFGAFPDSVRKVIDTHDHFADRHRKFIGQGIPGGFWLSFRPEDEARGLRRANAIIAIQPEEADIFRQQLGEHPGNPELAVVNHFIDLPAEPVSDHAPCRALFLASRNPANTLSARDFIANVLPLVLDRLPEFRLVLAGMICEVVDDHPAVIKLGRVEQPIDAFRQAPVLVNPMLVGTGINIKILDAMAAGVPVVSTDTGARGLPEEFRSSVLTVPERDHDALAARLVALVQDVALRRELGGRARRNAQRWNELQHEELRTALQGQRGGAPAAMTGT